MRNERGELAFLRDDSRGLGKFYRMDEEGRLQALDENFQSILGGKDTALNGQPISIIRGATIADLIHGGFLDDSRGLGKFYRMDEEQREAVKDFVNNMKRQNLIRDAASPWNSPLLAVPKTDQSAGIVRQCPKLAITVPIAGPEKQANHGYGPTLRHKLSRHWKSVHRRRHGSHGFSSMA